MPERPFLQIPGPTLVPERIVRAMAEPIIDHRGPRFGDLGHACLDGLKDIFQTRGHILLFPGSGTGAWEVAIVNTLSPGDRVLACIKTFGVDIRVGAGLATAEHYLLDTA
jgi:alanine-glyoxylate transaminase / serine-glyoxylate transaminase / serine-pyruvate transaminase